MQIKVFFWWLCTTKKKLSIIYLIALRSVNKLIKTKTWPILEKMRFWFTMPGADYQSAPDNAHSLEGLQKHPPDGAWKLILTFYDLFTASSKWVLRKIFFNFVKCRNSKNEVRFNKHCRRLEIKLKYLRWVLSVRAESAISSCLVFRYTV